MAGREEGLIEDGRKKIWMEGSTEGTIRRKEGRRKGYRGN